MTRANRFYASSLAHLTRIRQQLETMQLIIPRLPERGLKRSQPGENHKETQIEEKSNRASAKPHLARGNEIPPGGRECNFYGVRQHKHSIPSVARVVTAQASRSIAPVHDIRNPVPDHQSRLGVSRASGQRTPTAIVPTVPLPLETARISHPALHRYSGSRFSYRIGRDRKDVSFLRATVRELP